MKYINLYSNHEEYLEYNDVSGLTTPNVSVCEEENECHYMQDRCLTFFAGQDNTKISIKKSYVSSYLSDVNIEYSLDGITWEKYSFNGVSGYTITLENAGDFVEFRNNTGCFSYSTSYYFVFNINGLASCSGDVTSLINGYGGDCKLSNYCFVNLFYNCSGLTGAPNLPSTTLEEGCYQSMFNLCTSLTTAPELPAKKLVSNCYTGMFSGCSSLNYIKALFTTTPSNSYTSDWVRGVASAGTFVKNSSATWTTTGVNGVPTGWTVETASQ